MATLSYSFHIGSSGRTHKGDRKYGADNSYKTVKQAENAFKHNLRAYNSPDRDKSLNITLIGSDDPKMALNEFREAYKKLFDPYLEEYNKKQTREDRKIDDYLEKIEADKKKEVAVESIIQVGDKEFWDNYDIKDRQKMTKIFENQLKLLQEKAPNYHIVNATIHYDEASPHLHIIGIPYSDGYKNGMYRQVAKNKVFNKISLAELQAELRKPILEKMQEIYGEHIDLKAKEQGRNYDLMVDDYKKLKDELEKKYSSDIEYQNYKKLKSIDESIKPIKTYFGKIDKEYSKIPNEKLKELQEASKDNRKVIENIHENYNKEIRELKAKQKKELEEAEKRVKEANDYSITLITRHQADIKTLNKIIIDEQEENKNKDEEIKEQTISLDNLKKELSTEKEKTKKLKKDLEEEKNFSERLKNLFEKTIDLIENYISSRIANSFRTYLVANFNKFDKNIKENKKTLYDEIKDEPKISKKALNDLKEEIEPKRSVSRWQKEKEENEIEL